MATIIELVFQILDSNKRETAQLLLVKPKELNGYLTWGFIGVPVVKSVKEWYEITLK